MTFAARVLDAFEERLGDCGGERRDVRPLQHRDGFLAGKRRHQLRVGEWLQELDRHHADLLALAAQIGADSLCVVGYRAEADDHGFGIVAHERLDRLVLAARKLGVLRHCLAYELRYRVDEVRAMVNRAGLEVGLVLHAAGDAGIVDVDQRRNELTGALLERIEPLPPPLAAQLLREPAERLGHQLALIVLLDRVRVGIEK